jgi:hypothetical protein
MKVCPIVKLWNATYYLYLALPSRTLKSQTQRPLSYIWSAQPATDASFPDVRSTNLPFLPSQSKTIRSHQQKVPWSTLSPSTDSLKLDCIASAGFPNFPHLSLSILLHPYTFVKRCTLAILSFLLTTVTHITSVEFACSTWGAFSNTLPRRSVR